MSSGLHVVAVAVVASAAQRIVRTIFEKHDNKSGVENVQLLSFPELSAVCRGIPLPCWSETRTRVQLALCDVCVHCLPSKCPCNKRIATARRPQSTHSAHHLQCIQSKTSATDSTTTQSNSSSADLSPSTHPSTAVLALFLDVVADR